MEFEKRVIAAVRGDDEFEKALKANVDVIFDLNPDLLSVEKKVKAAHENKKKIFIHIDLASGIGKDKSGLTHVKNLDVDGIISTRANIIKIARELGMFTVQRFFIIDSQSVDTTVETQKSSKADMIEIMPGVLVKALEKLKGRVNVPVIAGGLIEDKKEVELAFEHGAAAVSTGKEELWGI